MTTDMTRFAPALLGALGLDVTPGRVEFLTKWAAGENTDALWNPLATTLDMTQDELLGTTPSGRPLAWWNDIRLSSGAVIHVMQYRDLASGVDATARTIKQANFAVILQSLTQEHILPGLSACIRSTWGTADFADQLDAGWQPAPWASSVPPAPAQAFTDAQLAVIKAIIDAAAGPTFLALLRQVLGLDESTFSAIYAPKVLEARNAMTGVKVPDHTHTPGGVAK